MSFESMTTPTIPYKLLNVSGGDNESMELYPDIRQPVYMVALYSVAYGIIFLFALFGNIVVVAVVFRNRRMHNLTNLFIVNLAIADILVAVFCIPITLLHNLYNGELLPLHKHKHSCAFTVNINPHKPSALFTGHRKTVQIQIRHRIKQCLIRIFTVCLQNAL